MLRYRLYRYLLLASGRAIVTTYAPMSVSGQEGCGCCRGGYCPLSLVIFVPVILIFVSRTPLWGMFFRKRTA
ncbi:hypothetical protein EEB11_07580 [Pseudotabrizicola sediminis]|uniref:Uncharacterized protein n=1 Tax=Pseudotabrizicola sediminis TaxID=2486418 RepID=A0ABY2KMM1_9RHOB|nr:hypothetical protein EEB11_07580 [Pseudotabrizicola sediminis]